MEIQISSRQPYCANKFYDEACDDVDDGDDDYDDDDDNDDNNDNNDNDENDDNDDNDDNDSEYDDDDDEDDVCPKQLITVVSPITPPEASTHTQQSVINIRLGHISFWYLLFGIWHLVFVI